MGLPGGLTCIVSPTGNRTQEGPRQEGADVGPSSTTPEVGFWVQLQAKKFPSHVRDSNLRTPAFMATLVVTNYTNGIPLPPWNPNSLAGHPMQYSRQKRASHRVVAHKMDAPKSTLFALVCFVARVAP